MQTPSDDMYIRERRYCKGSGQFALIPDALVTCILTNATPAATFPVEN